MKGPTGKASLDAEIVAKIREIQEETYFGYGYRPMTVLLKAKGVNTNENHVLSLMCSNGLLSAVRRKKYSEEVYLKRRQMKNDVPPDLIQRHFFAIEPARRMVGDITYLPVLEGMMYLNTIEDLFNGEILAFRIGEHPDTELCVETVLDLARMVGGEKCLAGAIIHTDAGSTYRAYEYRWLLRRLEVRQSMGETCDVYDNAAMESLNGIIKTECLYNRFGKTKVENHMVSKENLVPIVELYVLRYNNERPKEALGNLSPVKFREQNPKGKFLVVKKALTGGQL